MPVPGPVARRRAPWVSMSLQKSRYQRPPRCTSCGTSIWPKPIGPVTGDRTSQVRRSRERAWPTTPRSVGSPARARAVTRTWNCPSSGCMNTQGSRHAWSCQARQSRVSYQRGSASRTGRSCLRQRTRSSDTASPIRCTSPPSAPLVPVYSRNQRPSRPMTLPVQVLASSQVPRGPGDNASGEGLPPHEVTRDGVAYRGVPVALVRVADVGRGLQVEQVMVRAVADQPEVPDPPILECQPHSRTTLSCARAAAEPRSPGHAGARARVLGRHSSGQMTLEFLGEPKGGSAP